MLIFIRGVQKDVQQCILLCLFQVRLEWVRREPAWMSNQSFIAVYPLELQRLPLNPPLGEHWNKQEPRMVTQALYLYIIDVRLSIGLARIFDQNIQSLLWLYGLEAMMLMNLFKCIDSQAYRSTTSPLYNFDTVGKFYDTGVQNI